MLKSCYHKGTFTILNNFSFFTSFTTVIPASTASWCKACIGSVQYDAVTMSVFKAMHLLLYVKRHDITIIGYFQTYVLEVWIFRMITFALFLDAMAMVTKKLQFGVILSNHLGVQDFCRHLKVQAPYAQI